MKQKQLLDFISRHSNNLKFILLVSCLLPLSCKEKTTDPVQDDGIRTDTQLQVESYSLPSGQTAEFPTGFEIIANESVEIAGNILVKPDRPGNFTIRCLNGDMNISGKIIVQDDTSNNSGSKKNVSGLDNPNEKSDQHGTPLFFIVDRPGSVISIGRGAQIKSGNGRNAQDELIVILQGKYVGSVGAPGGDIIIRAHGGKIILPDLQEGDAPLFILGNGGSGANVIVDRNNFQTAGPVLELVGGRGGDSGILFLEADTIEGIQSPEELNTDLLSGGEGGRGGYVFWFPSIDKTYPLQQIIFQGGNGGNGAVTGGRGGLSAYWSLGIINEIDEPTASVSVTGGNGGNVFGSPLPIELAQGGDGGEGMVIGNDGRYGVHPDSGNINGTHGGDVIARGGNGGNVLEEVLFHSAIGGNGAMDEFSLTLIRLSEEFGIELLFQTWIISGVGGDGWSGCDGCPGGNGGNSGNIQAYGGNGGDVPNRIGARGGNGGDVWQVIRGLFAGMGRGGSGNPPGKGGCPGSIIVIPGEGGSGYLPGEDGTLIGDLPDSECGADGALCGESLNCDGDGGGGDDNCDKDTTFFIAYALLERVGPSSLCEGNASVNIRKEITIEGMYRRGFGWNVLGGIYKEFVKECDRVLRDTTVEIQAGASFVSGGGNPIFIANVVQRASSPYCHEGNLMWGDEPGGIDITVVSGPIVDRQRFTLSGCNQFGYAKETRSQYRCCQNSTGTWYVCKD